MSIAVDFRLRSLTLAVSLAFAGTCSAAGPTGQAAAPGAAPNPAASAASGPAATSAAKPADPSAP